MRAYAEWLQLQGTYSLFYLFIYFFGLFAISWAAPVAYGGSQARGPIRAIATGLHHSHSNAGIRAASVTYTIAHSHVGSLTH